MAKRPPSRGTRGRKLRWDDRDDVHESSTRRGCPLLRNCFENLEALRELELLDLDRSLGSSSSRGVVVASARRRRRGFRSSLIDSAPMLRERRPRRYFGSAAGDSRSSGISFFSSIVTSGQSPESTTTNDSKYRMRSRSRSEISRMLPDTRRQTLEEPHVRRRAHASSMWPMRSRRTLDLRDFDAALVADHAFVLHALVLAAEAFPSR